MNDMLYPTVLRCAAATVCGALALLAALDASGQETGQVAELAPVEIHRKTNPGDLPYSPFIGTQAYLQSLLPPDARMVELRQRVNFHGLNMTAQDIFLPESWAVAIVGDHVDQTVPVSRGGYFLLPDLPAAAAQGATIMFNTQTRKGYMTMIWKLRIPESQTIAYADFARALDEATAVHKKIPWYRYGLRNLRRTVPDGLRACFLEQGGRIDIGGQAASTRAHGACQVLQFDPAIAREGKAEIAFIGTLDIVMLKSRGQ
jgi:hypothetical protein